MYKGDRSRKTTLVEFGFRLPSALDNRPLKWEEFLIKTNQLVFVSAPGARMTDDQFVAITRRALERLPQLPPYPG